MYTLIKYDGKVVLDRTKCWYETLFIQARDFFEHYMAEQERHGVTELDISQIVEVVAKQHDIYGYAPYHMQIPKDVYDWVDMFVEWYINLT